MVAQPPNHRGCVPTLLLQYLPPPPLPASSKNLLQNLLRRRAATSRSCWLRVLRITQLFSVSGVAMAYSPAAFKGKCGCAMSSDSVFCAGSSPALTSIRLALQHPSASARRSPAGRAIFQYLDILASDARASAKSVAIWEPGSTGSTTCSDAWPQQSSQDAYLAASFQRRIARQSAIRQRFCIHAVFHTTRTSFSSVETDGRSARISCTSQI